LELARCPKKLPSTCTSRTLKFLALPSRFVCLRRYHTGDHEQFRQVQRPCGTRAIYIYIYEGFLLEKELRKQTMIVKISASICLYICFVAATLQVSEQTPVVKNIHVCIYIYIYINESSIRGTRCALFAADLGERMPTGWRAKNTPKVRSNTSSGIRELHSNMATTGCIAVSARTYARYNGYVGPSEPSMPPDGDQSVHGGPLPSTSTCAH
jgi:hypothetical protein